MTLREQIILEVVKAHITGDIEIDRPYYDADFIENPEGAYIKDRGSYWTFKQYAESMGKRYSVKPGYETERLQKLVNDYAAIQ